jgi:hypothetical protein
MPSSALRGLCISQYPLSRNTQIYRNHQADSLIFPIGFPYGRNLNHGYRTGVCMSAWISPGLRARLWTRTSSIFPAKYPLS